MREIKFRGKRVDDGEWDYGVPIVNTDCVPPKYMMQVCVIGGGLGIGYKEVIPETLGQFTGLKDKNGKMIFEGDVIHVDNYDEGWDSIVEFKGGAFAADVEGKDYDYTAIGWLEYEVEVIGNIHEGATPCTSATVE